MKKKPCESKINWEKVFSSIPKNNQREFYKYGRNEKRIETDNKMLELYLKYSNKVCIDVVKDVINSGKVDF